MMLPIQLLFLAVFVAIGRGYQYASLCFKLNPDSCTSAQVLLVVEYSNSCERYSDSFGSNQCLNITRSSTDIFIHWFGTGTCSVADVKVEDMHSGKMKSLIPLCTDLVRNYTSSKALWFTNNQIHYKGNKPCSTSVPNTSLCPSSVSTTFSSVLPSSSFVATSSQHFLLYTSQLYSDGSVSVSYIPSSSNNDHSQTLVPSSTLDVFSFIGSLSSSNYPSTSIQPSTSIAPTSSQYSSLHTSQLYFDGSVSVPLIPSSSGNDLSQTESSPTSTYSLVSTAFQTSSILVVPSSTLDMISFFRSLTSSEYPSIFIQPSTSNTPTSSHYSSTSILTISFPSVYVLPPSPPFLYCTADEQWPETVAGYTANGTCYRGTVNATRYCNETGEWNETICHTSESFGAIMSLISSPQEALTSLSQQINSIPMIQAVVLLDTIVMSNSNYTDVEEFTITLLSAVEEIVNETSTISDENVRQSVGSQILLTLDSFALSLDQNFTFKSDNIVLNAQRILSLTGDRLTGITFKGNEIVLPSEIFIEKNIPFTIASFVYLNMSSLLVPSNERELISPVVSTALNCSTDSNCITTNLTQLVNISFSLSNQKILKTNALSCAFWNFTKSANSLPSGFWNEDGCELVVTRGVITCQCDHLTHFGILLSPRSETGDGSTHDKILTTIGQVLVPVSLLCMLLVILTYTCMRSLWTMRNYIHVMLSTNLFVSQLIFLIGIEQTSNQSVCSGIAVVLQYTFLVTFMWMLMEGIVLYVTLVTVFIKSTKYYIIAFTLISYGVPAIYMIIITPIGFLVGTGSHSHYMLYKNNQPIACWLNYESGFIWSFIAPVILIIFANIGFFIMAIYIIRRHEAKHPEKAKRVQTKHWIKVSLSLSIVMGIGWLGCVLFFSQHLIFIAYIMTAFIAGQGIIIFILYVPFSKQVREAYASWWRRKKANPVILIRYIPIFSVSSQNMDRIEVKVTPMGYDNKYTYSGSYKEQKNGDTDCEKNQEKQTSFSS